MQRRFRSTYCTNEQENSTRINPKSISDFHCSLANQAAANKINFHRQSKNFIVQFPKTFIELLKFNNIFRRLKNELDSLVNALLWFQFRPTFRRSNLRRCLQRSEKISVFVSSIESRSSRTSQSPRFSLGKKIPMMKSMICGRKSHSSMAST